MSARFPARLHVLLARDATTAVVIRRGPARHVCAIGWDRRTDRFTPGQWMIGRIYERRCDLSPDGKHLLYFAMKGSSQAGTWTAVSKAPYLKALTLWPKGDCWNGGGLFLSAKKYWLNGCHKPHEGDTKLTFTTAYQWPDAYGGECPGVYYLRLQRDDWKMHYNALDRAGDKVALFEKRIYGHWRLRKFAVATIRPPRGSGMYLDRHQLYNARTEEAIEYPRWEWAEVDGDRLVWAERGKLFAGTVARAGLITSVELHDFNTMQFEPLEAPY